MSEWTRLLAPVLGWWRAASPAAERSRPVPAAEPRPTGVPAEYLSLHSYLDHRYATTVVLTFEQMEALLGFTLPRSARTEPEWWTTTSAVGACSHAAAWAGAGRTAVPNLLARIVTFERSL